MITLTKLNDVFDDWLTGDGIFTDLNEFNVPWKTGEETDADLIKNLNMAYHGSHSGDKNISPIVHKFLTSEDTETREKLAGIIYTMFGDKWSKLWDAFNMEYNPIENYSMTEHEERDDVTTREGSDTLTMTGTDTDALTGTTENEVSAFNSSDYSDNTKNEQLTTNTETRNMTDTTTHDTTDTLDGERTLTRSGNIGVTTSQQMLQSEIELRKWLYFNSVFNDIDTILTLSIY